MPKLELLKEEWSKLNDEFAQLDDLHKQYKIKVDEIEALQSKCKLGVKNHSNRLKEISSKLKAAIAEESSATRQGSAQARDSLSEGAETEDKDGISVRYEREGDSVEVQGGQDKQHASSNLTAFKSIREEIAVRKNELRDIEDVLPKDNGIYLRIILGTVNVSLISKAAKYAYKNDYELFKLRVTSVAFALSLLILTILKYRFWETILTFLLVWYYCTLTIRESILTINGSRIKGWWVTHHFVSTVVAGVLLVWPDGTTYQLFRTQYILFVLYLSFVQFLQYYYQRGCLYRLRALGERHNMDITAEGFQSWMWKGLSFILPFLCAAYIFQLYNAYVLMRLSFHEDCDEWQVPLLSALFLVLFVGNVGTTLLVMRKKIIRGADYLWALRNKYKME